MLSCQPSAPGMGSKSGPIWKRVCSVVAPPAGEARQLGSLAWRSCTKQPAIAARAAVQVLVAAPHGEVGVPVVQLQAAGCRRRAPGRSRRCSPAACAAAVIAAHVEGLAGAVVHAAQQHQRDRWPSRCDRALDRLPSRMVPRPARRCSSISASPDRSRAKRDLRATAYGRRERAGLDEDLVALARRPVEARPSSGAGSP